MAYSLDQFSSDCHDILTKDSGAAGLEQVRQNLENALSDPEFVDAHLGPDNNEPRTILYEDPDMGFCIVAHVYDGAKGGLPHDHGSEWGYLWPSRRHNGNDRMESREKRFRQRRLTG